MFPLLCNSVLQQEGDGDAEAVVKTAPECPSQDLKCSFSSGLLLGGRVRPLEPLALFGHTSAFLRKDTKVPFTGALSTPRNPGEHTRLLGLGAVGLGFSVSLRYLWA